MKEEIEIDFSALGRLSYEETVSYIEEIPKFTKKAGLDHTIRLLDQLDHPERSFAIIHVAGTNGKGSVCAFLQGMLTEGGYRCGLFTSPHLVRINERFQVDGEEITDSAFVHAFRKVMEAVRQTMGEGDSHPTYFELLFLMAVVYFQDQEIDYCVLETGLGGRLDLTNVVEHPLACVLTSISFDHMEYLGHTIPEIAWEKAGILKKGSPVVYDASNAEAEEVILRRAHELGIPAVAVRPDQLEKKKQSAEGIIFDFWSDQAGDCFEDLHENGQRTEERKSCFENGQKTEGQKSSLENGQKTKGQKFCREIKITSVADYQMTNAALAFRTMLLLQDQHGIPEEKLKEAISHTRWSCRMEMVRKDVVIDGAHNADGIAALIRAASHFHQYQELTILFSAVSDKEYPYMIREICQGLHPEHVVTTSVGGKRSNSAEEMADIFRSEGCKDVTFKDDVQEAFALAEEKKGEGILFCIGSLYLAGQLKALLESDRKF